VFLCSYISDLSSKKARTHTLGQLLSMNYFGYFIGSLAAGVLLSLAEFDFIFGAVILVNCACVLTTILCMRESVAVVQSDSNEVQSRRLRCAVVHLTLNVSVQFCTKAAILIGFMRLQYHIFAVKMLSLYTIIFFCIMNDFRELLKIDDIVFYHFFFVALFYHSVSRFFLYFVYVYSTVLCVYLSVCVSANDLANKLHINGSIIFGSKCLSRSKFGMKKRERKQIVQF